MYLRWSRSNVTEDIRSIFNVIRRNVDHQPMSELGKAKTFWDINVGEI